jgi:hypothetical protein
LVSALDLDRHFVARSEVIGHPSEVDLVSDFLSADVGDDISHKDSCLGCRRIDIDLLDTDSAKGIHDENSEEGGWGFVSRSEKSGDCSLSHFPGWRVANDEAGGTKGCI